MIGLYFDEHLRRAVSEGLIRRGRLVVMAVDVGMTGRSDEEHLSYATSQGLVVVAFDRPFGHRAAARSDFLGLVCLHERVRNRVGRSIELLDEFAQLYDPERDRGQVFWLG